MGFSTFGEGLNSSLYFKITNNKELSLKLIAPNVNLGCWQYVLEKRLIYLCIKDLSTELIKHKAENIFGALVCRTCLVLLLWSTAYNICDSHWVIDNCTILQIWEFDEYQEATIPGPIVLRGLFAPWKKTLQMKRVKAEGEDVDSALYFNWEAM